MRVLSWNVNGIRAVYKKGFLDWLESTGADIVCLQETKAHKEQLEDKLINVKGYNSYFSSAIKKGYSGVAIYSKEKPRKVEIKLGIKKFDDEGRILKLEYPNFTLLNLYIPKGDPRVGEPDIMDFKLGVYKKLSAYLKENEKKNIIVTGDFNIAHKAIDLARPKENENNTGFTLPERKRIDELVGLGYIDTFREFNKENGNYTWWSYRTNAREKNIGWRIDYFFISPPLKSKLKKAYIFNQVTGSDHCPVGIELDI
jgi:exodeoxyribonuclease-3